jgi:hypothetical protein
VGGSALGDERPEGERPRSPARGFRGRGPRAAFALALALFGSGCSFFIVNQHPDWKTDLDRPPNCTASYAPAVLDAVLFLSPVGLAAADLGKSASAFNGSSFNRPTSIGIDLLVATLFAASAAYGYVGASVCEDAIAHQQDAIAHERDAQRARLLRFQENLLRDDARDSDDGDSAAAAAQAKAFGEAARAASPSSARPVSPK